MPSLGIAPPREAAAGHCSPCRTRRRRFRASFRRAFTCTFWRLGFRQSSFRRVTRAPQRLAPYAWARAPVSWHALVPVHLSAAGQPSDPEINLQSLPARREIRPSASWRRQCLKSVDRPGKGRTFPGDRLKVSPEQPQCSDVNVSRTEVLLHVVAVVQRAVVPLL